MTGVRPDRAVEDVAPLVEGAAREWVAESLAEGLGLAERVLTRCGPVAAGEGGAGGEAREPRRFWDGSRDRWISVVSARVDPDAVRPPPACARRACAAG